MRPALNLIASVMLALSSALTVGSPGDGNGLWSTAADLARLAAGWSSLLPRSLAAQALRPHATRPNGVRSGLGWAVNEHAGLAGHGGDGPGGAASLLVTLDGERACAALANRQATVEPVNAQALAAMAGRSPE